MGDFCETPEQTLTVPPAELKKFSQLVLKEKGAHPGLHERPAGGRCLKLAQKNDAAPAAAFLMRKRNTHWMH